MLGRSVWACHCICVTEAQQQADYQSPLAIPDYRRFWLTRFLAVFATIGMVVLIGYQTYDVARADYGMGVPRASFQLGLLGLAQFVPLALLTPIAGFVADRFDRRFVVVAANSVDSLIALALALLTMEEMLNLPILFGLAALHGAVRTFNGPALSSIAPNIVPHRLLPRAIALGSIAWQSASVLGPMVGGWLFERNAALPYFLASALLLTSCFLILKVRPVRAQHDGPPRHPLRQIIDGAVYVWREKFLLGCITLDLFAVLLAGATALLPVFARDFLHVGADGLGMMRGAIAAGAAIVALCLSFRPIEDNVGLKMIWAVVVYGAATIAFAFSRNFVLSLSLLALLGAADMISVFIRGSLVQLNTPDDRRGRVSAISGLAISASNELGEMQSGLAAALLGATWAVVFGGAGAIVVALLWMRLFPQLPRARTFDSQFLHKEHDR